MPSGLVPGGTFLACRQLASHRVLTWPWLSACRERVSGVSSSFTRNLSHWVRASLLWPYLTLTTRLHVELRWVSGLWHLTFASGRAQCSALQSSRFHYVGTRNRGRGTGDRREKESTERPQRAALLGESVLLTELPGLLFQDFHSRPPDRCVVTELHGVSAGRTAALGEGFYS